MPKVGESKLGAKLKEQKAKYARPVWDGPCSNTAQGGITQSILSELIMCWERGRLYLMEGMKSIEGFSKPLEFGNMWHIAEEVFAISGNPIVNNPIVAPPWLIAVQKYASKLCAQYPLQQDEVNKWYNVVRIQFPIAVDHWKKHPDQEFRTNLMSETAFRVPYLLPTGRIVILRGKLDLVDLVGKAKTGQSIFLTDHKTKGEIKPQQLLRQLNFDLQTMFYIVALETLLDYAEKGLPEYMEDGDTDLADQIKKLEPAAGKPLGGFFYNVIRRPLSGGKGSIVRHKETDGAKCPKCKGERTLTACPKCNGASRVGGKAAETHAAYYERLEGIIKELSADPDSPDKFFFRWKVEISPRDILRYKKQFLEPMLENVADAYEWWEWCKRTDNSVVDYLTRATKFPDHRARHYRLPYGVYNPIAEGYASDLDEFLASGMTAGIQRVSTLFQELEI